MKYAIIENEEFARRQLQQTVQTLRPASVLLFTAETVEESLEKLAEHPDVELIFMDIELDDGNCFEIFRRQQVDTPVIFTTAYDQYAIRAFKVNSIDYLLKPHESDDVAAALRRFEARTAPVIPDYAQVAAALAPAPPTRTRLLVSSGADYYYVPVSEVAWLESEDKYVMVVLLDGHRRLTDFASLQEVAGVLPPASFFQLSRSVVASISAITKVSKHFKGRLRVELKAGERRRSETVSAARRPEFLDWFGYS